MAAPVLLERNGSGGCVQDHPPTRLDSIVYAEPEMHSCKRDLEV